MRVTSGRHLMLVALALGVMGAGAPDAPLVDAAKNADREAVRALIQSGADVNMRAGDGSTALLWASYRDDVEMADLLIKAGADVKAANDLGATPIWAASRNGSAAMAKKLLDSGADPNAALLLGEAAVITASRSGNPEVVELLLAKGADPNAVGARGQTALMFAAAQGHPDVVAVLLRHGAHVDARSSVWGQVEAQAPHAHPAANREFMHGGNTALMFAARVGDLESAKLLVAAGADVNAPSAWGSTPLAIAAYADFWPTLAENGAILHGDPNQVSPAHYAELVTFLLESGADPNAGSERFTPLIASLLRHHENTVDVLLANGADVNIPLNDWAPIVRGSPTDFYFDMSWVGASPLWLAARYSTPNIVRRLIEEGADPLFVHTGVYWGGSPGGNLSTRQEETGTTLHAAVRMLGNRGGSWTREETDEAMVLDIVTQLVEAGVDVHAVDGEGRTAVEGAADLEFSSVVDYLVSKGATRPAPRAPGADGRRR